MVITYCPRCYSNLPEVANYCPICGMDLIEKEEIEVSYVGAKGRTIVTDLKRVSLIVRKKNEEVN